MSGTPRVRWPYKQLWNLLRGESILADDEVILEELKLSYEQIIKALTQYVPPKPKESQSTSEKATAKTDGTDSETPEKKIRARISEYLELEESVAWEMFCSYMMFEYKGGSTSYDQLLETPRVTSEFLTDLKFYYTQERTSILLCLQALLGNLNKLDHKYYHIFEAFKEWADENGAVDMTSNLLKSLKLIKDDTEEIEVLHTLAILAYQMPHLSVKTFLRDFEGFRPGNKSEMMLQAESAVMYSVLLVPGFPSPEFPEEFQEDVEQFLINNAVNLLTNKYTVGALMGGFVSACPTNSIVQRSLTTSPHSSPSCVPDMTAMAKAYSKESNLNRHNLSNIVLGGLYAAVVALYDYLDSAIPNFGPRSSYFEFLAVVLGQKDIASRFLCDKPDLMNLYIEALVFFPLELKCMLGIWGSICGTVDAPEEAVTMLDALTGLLTSVAEYSTDPAIACPTRNYTSSSYRSPTARMVAGVLVPADSEIAYVIPDGDTDSFLVAWDLKAPLPVSLWDIISEEVLQPIIKQLKDSIRGLSIEDAPQFWYQRPREYDNVKSIQNFLTKFASVASSISLELDGLFESMAYIMMSTLELVRDMRERAVIAADLLQLITAANLYNDRPWTHKYFKSIWPGQSEPNKLIEDMIMGFESVANNDCKVTLCFLKSVLGFFKESDGVVNVNNPTLKLVAILSVDFITDNVFHSFTRWRMESSEVKFQVLVNCIKVYNAVFAVEDKEWTAIKQKCAHFLLRANSSLMTVLSTDDILLQQSVLKPDTATFLIPEVIYESLSLLLKLFQYQKDAIRLVDASLGLTLVQKLGRFSRHRLDYKIPTLSMALLKKIAEELNMSLLSCFGSDEIAFRDLVLQRLEFRSEDVNLKVAILEFLTVSAHTQPGLIQYLFMDDVLAQKIVDLPLEKDEGLSLSVLLFLRALFRKGATVMKKCTNLWESVFSPIRLLKDGGRVKIITCTLDILTIELFHCGTTNPVFTSEVKALLERDEFLWIVKVALSDRTEIGMKCLLAMKHFLTVVIGRNDLAEAFPETTRKSILDLISQVFWDDKADEVSDPKIATPMADLMCLLATSVGEYPEYLKMLSGKLTTLFFGDCPAVQVALMRLTNDCLKKVTSPVKPDVVENVVRIVCRVFIGAASIFQHPDLVLVQPTLRIAAVIAGTVIKSKYCSEWEKCFDHHLLTSLIVSVVHLGITTGKCADVVLECLQVMIRMAGEEKGSKMLQYSELSLKVWTPAAKLATPENWDVGWDQVYLLCIHLMTKLLRKQTHFFLDECFNFWIIHGMYIAHKLLSLADMTNNCLMNNPEENHQMMMDLLNFNVFALDAVAAMIPYYDEWKLRQSTVHARIMEGVFTVLKTSVNLLNQPSYIQVLISFAKTQAPHLEVRVTPQLLELQSKLWDVLCGSCHIYWKLRVQSTEFVQSEMILSTVHQVAGACIKGITQGERRHQQAWSNPAGRMTQTLEISLCIFHFHGQRLLQDQSLSQKQQQNFKREVLSDISLLCDGIRRVSKTIFLAALSAMLETTFK